MVKAFRVSDLQTLLASMGRSKSGLKQDLVMRALKMVQSECSPELLKSVRQLYETRFPKSAGWLAARRPEAVPVNYSSSMGSAARSLTQSSQGASDYLNGGSLPKQAVAPLAEVKLVSLPFYHTLETLLPPTELSECLTACVSATGVVVALGHSMKRRTAFSDLNVFICPQTLWCGHVFLSNGQTLELVLQWFCDGVLTLQP